MSDNNTDARELLEKALQDMASDMRTRQIGAILWDLGQASFHVPPQAQLPGKDGKPVVVNIEGLYLSGGDIYMIAEGFGLSTRDFYDPDTEVPPVVVTLTESQAAKELGEPTPERGFTRAASFEEWMVIADCYFEALTLDNDI